MISIDTSTIMAIPYVWFLGGSVVLCATCMGVLWRLGLQTTELLIAACVVIAAAMAGKAYIIPTIDDERYRLLLFLATIGMLLVTLCASLLALGLMYRRRRNKKSTDHSLSSSR